MNAIADAIPSLGSETVDTPRLVALFMRPDIAFALVWLAVFGAYGLRWVGYFPEPEWKVVSMISGSLVIGVASTFLWQRVLKTNADPVAMPDPRTWRRVILFSLAIWLVGFAAIVTYSGGMPIYWYPAGTPKTYVDYGIPTFSGAWNTFRVVLAILAALYLAMQPKLDAAIAAVLVLLTATVIFEVNRGGFILYSLSVLAACALVAPTWRRQAAWILLVSVVTLGGIYGAGAVRSTDPKAAAAIGRAFEQSLGTQTIEEVAGTIGTADTRAMAGIDDAFAPSDGSTPAAGGVAGNLATDPGTPPRDGHSEESDVIANGGVAGSQALSWVYLYLTTPIANLHYAATRELQPPSSPAFHTLYPMLPSVIRPVMPEESRYPLPLLVAGYTMTTAYGPFVADFGFFGASVAMGLQLALGTLVFMLARRSWWALILAPMFFATTVLGFFTNYFFTLLMPFHAALAVGAAWLLLSAGRGRHRDDPVAIRSDLETVQG